MRVFSLSLFQISFDGVVAMNNWIRRFRSLFSPARITAPMVPVLLTQSGNQPGSPATSLRSSPPPITELDLLRAFGRDV